MQKSMCVMIMLLCFAPGCTHLQATNGSDFAYKLPASSANTDLRSLEDY